MKLRILALCLVMAFGASIIPAMAQDFPGAGTTCTVDPTDDSGLPECGTPDDNECNPGGVLYRPDNQDGCPTEWYWKAGWFLARFNDGKIWRENFPAEFVSVLPPLEKLSEIPVVACMLDMTSEGYGMVSVPAAILNRAPETFNFTFSAPYYSDGTYTWAWHNGSVGNDLGFDFENYDYHVYGIGSGWYYPVTGDCTVNEAALPPVS